MSTHADKQENKHKSPAAAVVQKQSSSEPAFQSMDKQPEAVAQKKLQELANNNPRVNQLKAYQAMANNYSAQTAQRKENQEEETLQGKFEAIQKKENNTGLPDHLKSGIEHVSGYSMNDVKVHYNSDKPAQLQAHAYAQGTDIHIASGQEKHLPHEAWHVVQQKQGRVKPTMQMKGKVDVNDDAGLEKEADVMGAEALGLGQQVVQQYAMASAAVSTSGTKQFAKVSGAVVQLAEWKEGEKDKDATHYWDEPMDGVMWVSNGDKLWFRIVGKGKEDYRALEGERKTWEEWHALRKIAHPEEYPVDRPNYAGSLMERYNARYEHVIKWADGSGADELMGKNIVIDASVKKPDGATQSVYQNSYNVQTDTFSADWNQKKTDDDVGIKTSVALPNSDLLTCHRELARDFAISKGVLPKDDSNGFQVARHNINNDDWQNHIYPQLPIKVRGLLGGGLDVTRDNPFPFGKTVSHAGKDAVNMWQIFENMIPNTKAVFFMVAQRYAGYGIVAWNFKSGTATAIIRKVG